MNKKITPIRLLTAFAILIYIFGDVSFAVAKSGSGRDGNGEYDREDTRTDLRNDDDSDDEGDGGRDVFRFEEERKIIDENRVEREIRIDYRKREDRRVEQKIKYKESDGETEIEVEFKDEIEVEDDEGDDISGMDRTRLRVKLRYGENASVKIMPGVAVVKALEALILNVCSEANNCTIVLKDVGQREDDGDEIGDDKVNDNSIEADDDSNGRLRYEIRAEKRYRMFRIFERRAEVSVEVNTDSGEIVGTNRSWWVVFSSEIDDSEVSVVQ